MTQSYVGWCIGRILIGIHKPIFAVGGAFVEVKVDTPLLVSMFVEVWVTIPACCPDDVEQLDDNGLDLWITKVTGYQSLEKQYRGDKV